VVQVLIQPAYGTADARRYGAESLEKTVDFRAHADLLDPADLARLNALHASGRARFWGAKDKYDRRMDTVTTGDVGHGFRNPAFARRLWNPDPGKCLFSNVYSLRRHRRAGIPYEEIWALPGFTTGDNFMGLRFLDEPKSAAIIGLLRS
jgi:hypothetical protein